MPWFNGLMSGHNTVNKEVHFTIVNGSEKSISVQVFNEDPSEVGCREDDDDDDDASGLWNGYEPLSVKDLMPNQEWTFKRMGTCMYDDNHVGTILVEALENVYYFDANKGSRKKDISRASCAELVTTIKERNAEEEDGTSRHGTSTHGTTGLMDTIPRDEEEVMDVLINDDEDDEASPRVITLTIKNRLTAAARKKWMSVNTMEASLQALEFNSFLQAQAPRNGNAAQS